MSKHSVGNPPSEIEYLGGVHLNMSILLMLVKVLIIQEEHQSSEAETSVQNSLAAVISQLDLRGQTIFVPSLNRKGDTIGQ